MSSNVDLLGNSAAIITGRQKHSQTRESWLAQVRDGTIRLQTLFDEAKKSKPKDDTFALRKIQLIHVIRAMPSWDENEGNAVAVLWHNELDPKSKIESLFRNKKIAQRFMTLALSGPGVWQEVTFPDGWPWHGNVLEVLAGKGLPEIDAINGDQDQEGDDFGSIDELFDDDADEESDGEGDDDFGDIDSMFD